MGALSTPVTQMTTKLEQKPKKKKNKLNKNSFKAIVFVRIGRLGSIDERFSLCLHNFHSTIQPKIHPVLRIGCARMNFHQQLSPSHKIAIHVRLLNNIGLKILCVHKCNLFQTQVNTVPHFNFISYII